MQNITAIPPCIHACLYGSSWDINDPIKCLSGVVNTVPPPIPCSHSHCYYYRKIKVSWGRGRHVVASSLAGPDLMNIHNSGRNVLRTVLPSISLFILRNLDQPPPPPLHTHTHTHTYPFPLYRVHLSRLRSMQLARAYFPVETENAASIPYSNVCVYI